jgi:hypothetical protein
MKCPDKEDLQNKCTAAWNTYETAMKHAGLSIGPRTGTIMQISIKDLRAVAGLIDPQTRTLREPWRAAIALRWEHLKASAALSTHLSTHRC